MKISINAVLARCTLYCFQYFLQLTLELVFILFIVNGTQKKMLLALRSVPAHKQQFNKFNSLELINVSETNRDQNSNLFFHNDMINLNFESNLLKIDKKHYKGINIYYIGYITIKKIDDCENIYSVNSLCLRVSHACGYIEEKNGNKYLIFYDSVNENKGLLKKYADVSDGIKNEIKTITGGKKNNYGKDYMKIKFNFDDGLPLNKPLKFHAVTITIRSVFEEGSELYRQVFLDDALYEL